MFSLRDTGGAPLKCGSVEVGSQFLLRTDPFLALKHRKISCNLASHRAQREIWISFYHKPPFSTSYYFLGLYKQESPVWGSA